MASAIQQMLFSQTAIPRLERMLDLTAARQKLLTENVANAETPGYARKDIDFQAELKAAQSRTPRVGLQRTRPGHIGGTNQTHSYRVKREAPASGEMTSVELDKEMMHVAQNQLEFTITAQLARRKFEGLKLAIRGRR